MERNGDKVRNRPHRWKQQAHWLAEGCTRLSQLRSVPIVPPTHSARAPTLPRRTSSACLRRSMRWAFCLSCFFCSFTASTSSTGHIGHSALVTPTSPNLVAHAMGKVPSRVGKSAYIVILSAVIIVCQLWEGLT